MLSRTRPFKSTVSSCGGGIFGEVAKPADDATQFAQLAEQRGSALTEHLVELLGMAGARALQILDRDLQREQWVLQLVRQPAGKFAPCSHALGLHQAIALLQKFARHLVECGGQGADLVAGAHVYLRPPIARRHCAGSSSQRLHRPRDARSRPEADQQRQQNAAGCHQDFDAVQEAFQAHLLRARTAHQKGAHQLVVRADQRDGVKRLGASGVGRPCDGAGDLGAPPPQIVDQRRESRGLWEGTGSANQYFWFAIQQRAHAGRQHERRQEVAIERLPADHVQLAIGHARVTHRDQCQRGIRGQFFALQEWFLRIPVVAPGHPIVLVLKARRPLRRGNDDAGAGD